MYIYVCIHVYLYIYAYIYMCVCVSDRNLIILVRWLERACKVILHSTEISPTLMRVKCIAGTWKEANLQWQTSNS